MIRLKLQTKAYYSRPSIGLAYRTDTDRPGSHTFEVKIVNSINSFEEIKNHYIRWKDRFRTCARRTRAHKHRKGLNRQNKEVILTMTDEDSKLREFSLGGVNGMLGFAFTFLSMLAFGLKDNITSFLTTLTQTTYTIGPFDLSYALIASFGIVAISGGLNMARHGANSDANQWGATMLLGILGLMALPGFNSWASQQGVNVIFLFLTVSAYYIIGGVGGSSTDSDSMLPSITDKIRGGSK